MLMSSRLIDTLTVIISFDTVKDGKAYTIQDDEDLRHFTIGIYNKLSTKETIKAIAHEIVHVWQFASGRMKDYIRQPGKVKFGDKVYAPAPDEYYFLPWEVEAYGYEVGLYQHYVMMKKAQKKKELK